LVGENMKTIRTRVEELRSRARTRIKEIQASPLATNIREKGLLKGLRTRLAELRGEETPPLTEGEEEAPSPVLAPAPVIEKPRITTH